MPANGQWKRQHFHLTTPIYKRWANAIAANQATVIAPSIEMFDDIKKQRGTTTNKSRAPRAARLTQEALSERLDRITDINLRTLEFQGVQRLGNLTNNRFQYHP